MGVDHLVEFGLDLLRETMLAVIMCGIDTALLIETFPSFRYRITRSTRNTRITQ